MTITVYFVDKDPIPYHHISTFDIVERFVIMSRSDGDLVYLNIDRVERMNVDHSQPVKAIPFKEGTRSERRIELPHLS